MHTDRITFEAFRKGKTIVYIRGYSSAMDVYYGFRMSEVTTGNIEVEQIPGYSVPTFDQPSCWFQLPPVWRATARYHVYEAVARSNSEYLQARSILA